MRSHHKFIGRQRVRRFLQPGDLGGSLILGALHLRGFEGEASMGLGTGQKLK